MRFPAAFLLVGFLGGCHADLLPDTDQPEVPTFQLNDDIYWAGSTLRVASDAFMGSSVVVELAIGGMAVELSRIDQTTFEATIPSTISGNHAPSLTVDGTHHTLDAVSIYGPAGVQDFDLSAGQGAAPFRAADHASVIFQTTEGIHILDLDHGTIRTEPGVPDRGVRPGPTPDPEVWLLGPIGQGELELWNFAEGATKVGGVPRFHAVASFNAIAMLGTDRALTFPHDIGTITGPSGGSGSDWDVLEWLNLEGDKRVVISASGTHATVTTSGGFLDWFSDTPVRALPVFTVPDGAIAFTITSLRSATAVDFSPGGEQLAVAGLRAGSNATALHVFDTGSGALEIETLAGVEVRGLAYDPHRPLLYVVTEPDADVLELLVLETAGYTQVGRLGTSCRFGCMGEVLVVPSGQDQVFTFEGGNGVGGSSANRFTLPPTGALP